MVGREIEEKMLKQCGEVVGLRVEMFFGKKRDALKRKVWIRRVSAWGMGISSNPSTIPMDMQPVMRY